ncbi:lasso RiPP family leader peptide-containing protein [Saccharopolyspora sp. CA-218241]
MDEPTYRPPVLAEVGGFNADTLGSDVGFKDDGFLFYGG